jgi:hypothetical protein
MSLGNTVKFPQAMRGLVPEVLNAIDVVLPAAKSLE